MHPLFVIFFGFLATSHGYILDPGCARDPTIEALVVAGLNHAFDTASAAEEALNMRPWNRDAHGPLMDLADWIFREDGSAPTNTYPAFPPPSPMAESNPDDPRNRLDKARDVFNLILMNRRRTENQHPSEFIVFCDTDRYKTSERHAGKVWDSVLKAFSFETYIKQCGTNPFLQAWTMELFGESDILQICPRFLKQTAKARFPFSAPLVDLQTTNPVLFTTMDTYGALMDGVLLHEMTHTGWAGGLDDVQANGGPYRWKNILTKTPADSIKNAA
ncbi:hypothetical protein FQN55_005279 [Onygenales sp. PD_40]|nr:hypothetical protein FQN55_005279 [Onygenales sp. PD_40]